MTTSSMMQMQRGGLAWFEFEFLQEFSSLRHGISLRQKDGPEFDFSSRNRELARENIQRFCHALDLCSERMVRIHQIHSRTIAIAEKPCQFFEQTDGICTSLSNVPLMLLGADCPLIIVYDPELPAVGLAHAGWRGTVQRITANLVQTMTEKLSCKPARMVAGVGPGICFRCYQVGKEVFDAAEKSLYPQERCFSKKSKGSNGEPVWHFDLFESNRQQLIHEGVPEKQIRVSGYCTHENPELFYSYRREGENAGRWALLAGLVY